MRIHVLLNEKEAAKIDAIKRQTGATRSEIVRRALLIYRPAIRTADRKPKR